MELKEKRNEALKSHAGPIHSSAENISANRGPGLEEIRRDEPFLINVKGKPFAVPYTLHMNDIVDYESRYFSTQEYAGDLKTEFDMLDAESPKRRRMMSVSAHDRIARRPSRAKVLEEFIVYAQSNPGVVFKRKDEIARFALSSPQTVREGI